MTAPRALIALVSWLLFGAVAASAQTGARPDTSFAGLFTGLAQDVAHLATPEAAWTLGLGAGLSAALHPADDAATQHLAGATSVDGLLRPGNALGNGATQAAFAVGTWLTGRATHHAAVAEAGADLVRAQMLNGALTQGLKAAVGRKRPDGGRWSFPSGHTSATAATATVLWRHAGWKAGLPASAAAALVGASRIHDRRHYLSDVLFGAALGMTAGEAVTVGHGRARMALSPFARPGGGGVQLHTR